jgi:hypothetical protein
MKKNLIIVFVVGLMSLFANSSQAQISINFNVGAQPLWGPVGYDRADYYYLPDVESYYSVADKQYVYQNNGKWLFSNSLPSRYSGYNLYNGYKVVINQPKPYLTFANDRVKYAKYKAYKGKQPAIRYSNDSKYFVIKNHPKYQHGAPSRQAKKTYPTRSKYKSPERNDDRGNDKKDKGQHHGGKGKGHGKH